MVMKKLTWLAEAASLQAASTYLQLTFPIPCTVVECIGYNRENSSNGESRNTDNSRLLTLNHTLDRSLIVPA